jgi:hypothetical protein
MKISSVKVNSRKKVLLGISALAIATASIFLLNNTKKEYHVAPPLQGVDVEFVEFTYEPEIGAYYVDNCFGHEVEINAHSLVDANGKEVKEPVKLLFRAFNNAKDIFLSGIPMGSKYGQLQSAGMFELKTETKDVFIANSGDVKVKVASMVKNPSEFKSYVFNDGTGWEEIERFETVDNTTRTQVLVELDTLFERGKRELDEKQRRKKRTEKYFQLDFRHNDLGGEFVGMNLDNRLWEYVKVRGQENPFKRKYQRMLWSNVRLSNNNDGTFTIKLIRSTLGENPKQDEVTFTARPVLDEDNSEQDLENLERAIAEMDEYFEAIENQQRMWARVAEIQNVFNLNNWGIYNCDKVINDPVLAQFDVSISVPNTMVNDGEVYAVCDSLNTVITYNSWELSGLYMDYDKTMDLIAVNSKGQAYQKTITWPVNRSVRLDQKIEDFNNIIL